MKKISITSESLIFNCLGIQKSSEKSLAIKEIYPLADFLQSNVTQPKGKLYRKYELTRYRVTPEGTNQTIELYKEALENSGNRIYVKNDEIMKEAFAFHRYENDVLRLIGDYMSKNKDKSSEL